MRLRFLKWLKWSALATTCLIVIGVIDSLVYQSQPIDKNLVRETLACKNGLWLRYYWYRGKHNEADWLAMLDRLNKHKIRYAYFHVLGINPDGTMQYHQLNEARKITARVHQSCPDTLCLAWVYVPSDFSRKGVDLGNPQTRAALHKEGQWLINDCGFDGVQWDYEFAPNDDSRFLTFLKESRDKIPRDKHLSIATPMSYPMTLWGWNDNYFKKVAPFVDQVAVMAYDSFLLTPRAYGYLMARQVTHVSKDIGMANPACKVIMGLPTYEDVTLAHHSFCESLANSLRGFEQGVRDLNRESPAKGDAQLAESQPAKSPLAESHLTRPDNLEGVALFADYTTDAEEWALFDAVVRK